MNSKTAERIYAIGSYVFIIAATIIFFVTGRNVSLTLLILVLAVYFRVLMYRSRCQSLSSENETLVSDLRRLTKLVQQQSGQSTPKDEQ